jgi:DNA-binding beta-propeller fold protein YncE
MKLGHIALVAAFTLALAAALHAAGSKTAGSPEPLPIPGGEAGIGFDDLRFAPRLDRVLVPAGRAGILALVDPHTRAITAVPGFSKVAAWGGGHDQSVTSADEGDGVLFATDRTSRELVVVHSQRGNVLSRVRLGGGPDYVRWVAPTREIWVTEPDAERIEVFRLPENATEPAAAGSIPIPGGPESLVVDSRRQRAYANLWKGRTVAIDLITRAVGGAWENGCTGSRGLALDDSRGLLFVGCGEGGATALDVTDGGRIRGRGSVGAGVDVIDFDAARSHLYVPSGKTATFSILGVSRTGELRVLTTLPAAAGSHCVVTDHRGAVYVCDPKAGRLLVYRDTLPSGDH